MALSIQQHLKLPIFQLTHAGRILSEEVIEGCVALSQFCEHHAYDIVIDLSDAMYARSSGTTEAFQVLVETVAHPNVRSVTYVIPDAEHHDLARVLRIAYARADLSHKVSFTDTVDDAIAQIQQRFADNLM